MFCKLAEAHGNRTPGHIGPVWVCGREGQLRDTGKRITRIEKVGKKSGLEDLNLRLHLQTLTG